MDHFTDSSIGTFRVTCVATESLEALNAALKRMGFHCYQIDSRSIVCKRTLLAAFVSGFELNEYSPLDSWDAASDLIWQSFMAQSEVQAAIVWRETHQLLAGRFQILLDGLELLLSVADAVVNQAEGEGCHRVNVRVFLVGDGPNFPGLS